MSEANKEVVLDDAEHHRFVVRDGGHVAELVYRVEPERLVLVHTGVPEELGGRGIGGQLVRAAVERAAEQARTVVPQCEFARKWLHDHADVAGTVTIDWG
ncbi:MAG TPA: GNAT family N-acetyltransferase [Acidimicrobiia bacterium]